ncbi:MAG TPA: sigma-70 family RNA polymerase sigma factor [Chitinophagaceae bacterium]|nr:sigma-70 family RNA polymerase sigma factor [Chitinophagaceae bacterium]
MRNEANSALWNSFKQGNWNAYTSLYNDYYNLLNNYGYKFTRNSNLIEDAIHDLFVRLWTTRSNLGSPDSIKNYLYKSLRNTLLRKIKAEEKYTGIDTEEYPFGFEVTYNNQAGLAIEEKEFREKVKAVINTLPPRQKEIIYLRFYEGLSYDEIADIMSISINSAYKLLYKGLENLQQTLGPSLLPGLLFSFSYFS